LCSGPESGFVPYPGQGGDQELVVQALGGFQQQNPPLHHRADRMAACRRRQEVGKAAARASRSGAATG